MVARSQRHAQGRADLKQEEQRPVSQQPYIVGIEEGGMPARYSSEGRLDDRRRNCERRDEDEERNGMQHLEATKGPSREGRRLRVAMLVLIFVMLSTLGHDGRCEVGGGGMKRMDEDDWMRKVGVWQRRGWTWLSPGRLHLWALPMSSLCLRSKRQRRPALETTISNAAAESHQDKYYPSSSSMVQ